MISPPHISLSCSFFLLLLLESFRTLQQWDCVACWEVDITFGEAGVVCGWERCRLEGYGHGQLPWDPPAVLRAGRKSIAMEDTKSPDSHNGLSRTEGTAIFGKVTTAPVGN